MGNNNCCTNRTKSKDRSISPRGAASYYVIGSFKPPALPHARRSNDEEFNLETHLKAKQSPNEMLEEL